ncbi:MAG TPA: hypothetical protein VLL08_13010, partial [Kineosporiaceae bacterium]|nr:hypothetical protein [Kineosporiaceae bacterium]
MSWPAAGCIRAWLVLSLLAIALSVALSWAGLPSPALFGALAAGLIYALSVREAPAVPSSAVTAVQVPAVPVLAFTTGQAILGAS